MKKIVVVIPSYKNEPWCKKNVESVLNQNHDNFTVMYTEDMSPDGTADAVKAVVDNKNAHDKFELIRNEERLGAMQNLYNMIHACDDDDIVVTLDGDDWLAHNNVLRKIDEVYSDPDVWMTYGSYQDMPARTRGCCKPYNRRTIETNSFRNVPWRASHLRTYYAWLFKKIKKEDFYDPQGRWLDMAWDLGIMLPMLEMTGFKHRYVNEILYSYNNENPISDHKVNQQRQGALDRFIRSKHKYSRLG